MLVYAGIDEAGYGPMLGPLCVGLAVLRVREWSPGEGVPDLWGILSRAVAASAKEAADGRVPVADSKKLKLANGGARHPLVHLERGVLSFESCVVAEAEAPLPHGRGSSESGEQTGRRPVPPETEEAEAPLPQGRGSLKEQERGIAETDAELFGRLGADVSAPHASDEPWWAGDAATLPGGSSRDELRIACNVLHRELARTGVEVLALRCRVMGVREFNNVVEACGSKAAATEAGLVEHLRWVAQRWWPGEGEQLRVACDRQSGRVDYTGALAAAWDGYVGTGRAEESSDAVQVLEHSARASRYAAAGGRVGVQLVPEAEGRHFPVALASMTAKLVRELAMARFNRYWAARARAAGIELKPTAGYVQDARRWLDDMKDVVTRGERASMVRRA